MKKTFLEWFKYLENEKFRADIFKLCETAA